MAVRIVHSVVSVFGSRTLTLFIGLLITPLLVRLLGSSAYGDYAFLISLLSIIMILTNVGVSDGIRKHVAENNRREKWAEYVFGFYLRIGMALAIVAASICVVISFSGIASLFFGEEYTNYLYILASLIIVRQIYSTAQSVLMGLGKESRSEPARVLNKALFAVIALLLAYFNYGVTGVLVGHLVGFTIVTVIVYYILSGELYISTILNHIPDDIPKRKLLRFNLFSFLLILLTTSLYHADILLLRTLTSSQETGYYRGALVIAEFLWFVPKTFQTVFLYSASEMWSNEEADRITSLISKTTRYNISLTLLLVIGLGALAGDFIPLYFGEEFTPATSYLLLLLPGALGFAIARPIFAIGQGKGSLRILVLATGISAVLNILLNLVLIPRYGATGAAVATSISYGSMIIFHIISARKIGFNPLRDARLTRISAVALLSAPVIFGLGRVIDSSIISLIIVPPIGFLVYSMLTVKLKVIPMSELMELVEEIPEPFS